MRESKIEHAVCKWAGKRGIIHLKMRPYVRGYPDDLFMFDGACCFIEFKATKKTVKDLSLQAVRIRELKEQQIAVGVINDTDAGIAFLETTLISTKRG